MIIDEEAAGKPRFDLAHGCSLIWFRPLPFVLVLFLALLLLLTFLCCCRSKHALLSLSPPAPRRVLPSLPPLSSPLPRSPLLMSTTKILMLALYRSQGEDMPPVRLATATDLSSFKSVVTQHQRRQRPTNSHPSIEQHRRSLSGGRACAGCGCVWL